MKKNVIFLGAFFLLVVVGNAGADVVVFSADYDATLNAQVVPPGGSIVPVINEVRSNPVQITSGNQGYGGGEALLVPDYDPNTYRSDRLIYTLNPTYPDTIWFPLEGRVSMYFKVVTPDTGQWIQMFSFYYGVEGYEHYGEFSVWLGQGQVGGWAQFRSFDGWYDGVFHSYNNGTVAGAPNPLPGRPMSTPGWHKLAVEWDIISVGSGAGHAMGDLAIYVDEQLGLAVSNAHLGPIGTFEHLYLGSPRALAIQPIGSLGGGLYDEVVIEEVTMPLFCGDNNTVYLAGDISGPEGVADCFVNLYDFAEMAGVWLGCTDPGDVSCDAYWK